MLDSHVADVQQGETQTQRGSRKGNSLIIRARVYVRARRRAVSAIGPKAPILQTTFMLDSPCVSFPHESIVSLTQNPIVSHSL